MFSQSQPTSNKGQSANSEEAEVTIRNLPNEAKNQDIIEYLSIAGPIKSVKFLKQEQRYSAIVVYYDIQSAQLCKRFLDDRYYKGRALTIQIKKPYGSNTPAANVPLSSEEQLAQQIMKLKHEQKKALFGLLKEMKKDGNIFESFLLGKPKVVKALLNRYSHE